MKKIESLNCSKFSLNDNQMRKYCGGKKSEDDTENHYRIESDPSDRFPCGDYQEEIIYDGPWSSYMPNYCTMKKPLDCVACR